MKLIKRLLALLYLILMVSSGSFLVMISVNALSTGRLVDILNIIYSDMSYQLTVASIGGVFIISGVLAYCRIIKNVNKSRIISFQNPDGEVTISISAIEDYVKKVVKDIHDIANVRSRVFFNRKGINISIDVTMKAGANIPEVTEKIQMELKNKVHAMLGVEEKVNVVMHVSKIMGDTVPRGGAEEPHEPEPATVPFR